MATPPEDLGPENARRVGGAQIALAVVGVLVLLVLLWFAFLRPAGDEEDVAAPTEPVQSTPIEEPEDTDADAGNGRRQPVETFEVFAPKDPFDPLISASAATGGTTSTAAGTTTDGTGGTTTSGAATGDGTGTTTITTNGDGTGTGTGGGGGGGAGEDIDGHRVRVVDVYKEGSSNRAQVQVDGTVYTVDEGERFASNFRLISASGRCATMLYGDDEFTLCEGEEILK